MEGYIPKSEQGTGLHSVEERRGAEANEKMLQDLREKIDTMGLADQKQELVEVMEIMKKPRAEVTEEERARIRTMLYLAGKIQTQIAEDKMRKAA